VVALGEERTWEFGQGPAARDSAGEVVGNFVYAIYKTRPLDFALIQLDAGVPASPEVCHWGGPTSINRDLIDPPTPVVLRIYGQGIGVRDAIPARSMVAAGMPDPEEVRAFGVVIFGDSGGPVMTEDGRAVGIIRGGGLYTDFTPPQVGTDSIARLDPGLTSAEQALGYPLGLVVA
jgi:hypothetical protein